MCRGVAPQEGVVTVAAFLAPFADYPPIRQEWEVRDLM